MGACASTKALQETRADLVKHSPKEPLIIPTQNHIDEEYILVSGYYRNTEQTKIIPSEIIKLIISFYQYRWPRIFIATQPFISAHFRHYERKIMKSFGAPYCYIPNINGTNIHGIICTVNIGGLVSQVSSHPYLLIFDHKEDYGSHSKSTVIKYYVVTLLPPLDSMPIQFVYCGDYGVVVCIMSGYLFQLTLKDLDWDINSFGDKNSMLKFEPVIKLASEKWIMCYLPNKQQIFAVEWLGSNRACILFDCQTNELLQLKTVHVTLCKFGLCYDGFDNVYIVCANGMVIQYNLSSIQYMVMKEYSKLFGDLLNSDFERYAFWVDKDDINIIYCTDWRSMRCFDAKAKKWSMIYDDQCNVKFVFV